MALTATGGGQQHRRVDQCIQIDQVEQVLEQPRIGAAIDRRGDDQQVGVFDRLQFGFDVRAQFLTGQRRAQRPGDVTQLDQLGFDRQLLSQLRQQRLGQHQRAGWTPGATGNGDDFQWTRHDQFLFKQLLSEQ
ncbi:hypothetical protein D3C87_1663780 [compost metagenome]